MAWGENGLGQANVPPETWNPLGSGLAGVSGIPSLAGSGPLTQDSAGTLSLTSAAPSALAGLFISLSSTPADFKCGVLVPVPAIGQLLLITDGSGNLPLSWVRWPAGLSGTSLYMQYAIAGGASPCGISLSNALRADVP